MVRVCKAGDMQNWICETCGVQFSESNQPPAACLICEDDRQYVGPSGQNWTTLQQMQGNFHNKTFEVNDQIISIGPTQPKFAIGQRALLIKTPHGNVLWDCITLLDDTSRAVIDQHGGISMIAISHPHFYDTMVEWAQAFQCKILLHQADQKWVMRKDKAAKDHVEFWSGNSKQLNDSLELVRLGGHFAGSCILHSRAGEGFTGALSMCMHVKFFLASICLPQTHKACFCLSTQGCTVAMHAIMSSSSLPTKCM